MDQDFAQQAIKERNTLGTDEKATGIGDEAGPYTLNQPGVVHSGYHGILITPENGKTQPAPGETIALNAAAEFTINNKETTQDVTSKATWQLSDPSLATIDSSGHLTVAKDAKGTLIVVARWNDTTHEHSGFITFAIGSAGAATLNSSSTFLINGVPLK